jgi:hypothetical protein
MFMIVRIGRDWLLDPNLHFIEQKSFLSKSADPTTHHNYELPAEIVHEMKLDVDRGNYEALTRTRKSP